MTAISNELGLQLHDRWTKAEVLTAEEHAQLQEWYQQQDAEEARDLSPFSTTVETAGLQVQVDMALTQLTTVIQQVQQVTSENEDLRREISALQQQLSTLKFA
jgi:predicted  nucleic acid-binding Zn-ribbon protein